MDGLMDGIVKIVFRPFYPTVHPVCDRRNGLTDTDGDENCLSVTLKWTDPCIFCLFLWTDGWTVFDGDTPLGETLKWKMAPYSCSDAIADDFGILSERLPSIASPVSKSPKYTVIELHACCQETGASRVRP